MPGVPFCDLNDAYGSSEWEKIQNRKYINDEQTQTTKIVEDLQDPKNFLKESPGPKQFVSPKDSPNITNIGNIVPNNPIGLNIPTFNNALACNNRNNNFQQRVNDNVLRQEPINYNEIEILDFQEYQITM